MPPGPPADPLEVVTQTRSASIQVGSGGGFVDSGAPLRAAHVRAARLELEELGRRTLGAERFATQSVAARTRVIWRGWAQAFTASLVWEQGPAGGVSPRAQTQLDELNTLLNGPATRGELRVLEAYERYFHQLFTLGWAVVVRVDPGSDVRRLAAPGATEVDAAALRAWQEITSAWIAPWNGRRRTNAILEALLDWIDRQPKAVAAGERLQ